MVNVIYSFTTETNEISVRKDSIRAASKAAIGAIKNELPEEAQTMEVFNIVIDEMKTMLNEKKILL